MNIVFFGSDDFAATHLEALSCSVHKVCGCVTQPDKARGRGWHMSSSPIKETATRYGIPIFQPLDLGQQSFLKELRNCNGDLFVVIAYGRLLPPSVLAMPPIMTINVHSSLLPRYRGAAPINWAIINGEQETGLTIMKLTEELDAGDILAQEKITIHNEDTSITLRSRMLTISPPFLLKTIDSIVKETYTLTIQDANAATMTKKLTKAMGRICWDKEAMALHRLVRGLLPWPTAHTYYQGRLLKILETAVVPGHFTDHLPGEVIDVNKQGFIVATGQDALFIKRVHLEASRPMEAHCFIAGHKLEVGFIFS